VRSDVRQPSETFASARRGIAFAYPTDWVASEDSSGARLTGPNGGVVTVERLKGATGSADERICHIRCQSLANKAWDRNPKLLRHDCTQHQRTIRRRGIRRQTAELSRDRKETLWREGPHDRDRFDALRAVAHNLKSVTLLTENVRSSTTRSAGLGARRDKAALFSG
jgi:hypothetical protein